MIKKLFAAFMCLSIALAAAAQDESKEDIQKRQQQLQREIAELNSTLNQIKSSKKKSLSQLALVQKKIRTRNALINNINKDLRRLDNTIYTSQLDINRMRRELDSLKENYAKSLVFAYKNRSNYDYLNFIFSATSFNDAVKRIAYLRSYRDYRETQVNTIQKTQRVIEQKIQTLTSNKAEKKSTLVEQGKQLTVLQEDRKEQDDVLNNLKGRESDVAKQIKQNQRDQQKLKGALQAIINREIAEAKRKEAARLKALEEQRKREAAAAAARNNAASNNPSSSPADNAKTPPPESPSSNAASVAGSAAPKSTRVYNVLESTEEDKITSINFETRRGSLPWPVSSGIISIPFGSYTIPGTKITGNNSGINISVPLGVTVKSVADGTVSGIFDMGSGQAVVIRHGKYFTAYSNLNNIKVKSGTEVHAGTVLGTAGPGSEGDGEIVFMVENSSGGYLNPESWLR
ncbi:murein hydrolase activator EnvC family protein [Parafilimonas sp.]|uniref:murein hydrolase activator EnvC family protein n=1 Tax=Parafilimonas sp. TaxID=1969739 RepID=UPI003F7EA371